MLEHFRPGSLLVTSADRPDVLVAACLAAMNGVEIGAILLTGGYEMDARISKLCERAFATGLPVFMVNTNTADLSEPAELQPEVPVDDHERIEKVQEYVANYINADWIESLTATSERSRRLSPPAFRYQLTELARKAGKRVVLPEGDEPRTVKAAAICAERGIATCVLLGNPDEINRVAASQGVELGAGIEIVDPEVVRESYVARLVELRKNKGMTEAVAREQLEDNVVLGTLMLEQDEVDGRYPARFTPQPIPSVRRCSLSKRHRAARWSLPYSSCCCRNRFTFTATARSTRIRLLNSWRKSRFSPLIPRLPSVSNRAWRCSPTPPAPPAQVAM